MVPQQRTTFPSQAHSSVWPSDYCAQMGYEKCCGQLLGHAFQTTAHVLPWPSSLSSWLGNGRNRSSQAGLTSRSCKLRMAQSPHQLGAAHFTLDSSMSERNKLPICFRPQYFEASAHSPTNMSVSEMNKVRPSRVEFNSKSSRH